MSAADTATGATGALMQPADAAAVAERDALRAQLAAMTGRVDTTMALLDGLRMCPTGMSREAVEQLAGALYSILAGAR